VSEGIASRAAAARAVAGVIGRGATLGTALAAATPGLAPPERAQAQALAFGALRFGHRLKHVLAALLERPWERHAPELQALLLVGLYQVEYAETPAHAAVSTMVEAARALGQGRASGLVNACLRRFLRERAALLASADETLAGRFSHPEWLVARLAAELGKTEEARAALERLLAANNEPPPLVLRANALRISTEALADRLEAAGHRVHQVPFAPRALVLEQPLDVRQLPEFIDGLCSVQDAAAQLAAPLLAAAPGMAVLDACAAPGGKTCHLLEEVAGLGALVALDLDAARARRIDENLARLGLAARVEVGDALDPRTLAGRSFARILLDAPCSGSGVIRRHPDIKWLRRPADLARLAARQRRLLDSLWTRLEPGGRLLYASCSVLALEGPAVVAGFLAATPGAVDVTESASLKLPGLPATRTPGEAGLRLSPGIGGSDGFYYACLERSAH
jgi:16S rRNA (cytosine967-C5)-methyltransferase